MLGQLQDILGPEALGTLPRGALMSSAWWAGAEAWLASSGQLGTGGGGGGRDDTVEFCLVARILS